MIQGEYNINALLLQTMQRTRHRDVLHLLEAIKARSKKGAKLQALFNAFDEVAVSKNATAARQRLRKMLRETEDLGGETTRSDINNAWFDYEARVRLTDAVCWCAWGIAS